MDSRKKVKLRVAMEKMKNGAPFSLNSIPQERHGNVQVGEITIELVTNVSERILEDETVPKRKGLILIFNNKDYVENCNDYRGVMLISYRMKVRG